MGKSKHYRPGEIIYSQSKPFVYALCPDQRFSRCDHCFVGIEEKYGSISCLKCFHVRYCSLNCQNESVQSHRLECGIMVNRPIRTMTRLVLRALAKTRLNPANSSVIDIIHGRERTWECLMDHYNDIIRDVEAMFTFGLVVEDLESLLDQSCNEKIDVDLKQLLSIYGKILINSFAVTEPDSGLILGRALYLGASIFDHSCRPDLYFQFDGLTIYFVAARDLYLSQSEQSPGIDSLFISYIDEILPFHERQNSLRSNYYFECQCARCTEDSQRISYTSTSLIDCYDSVEDYFQSDRINKFVRYTIDYVCKNNFDKDAILRPPINWCQWFANYKTPSNLEITVLMKCQSILYSNSIINSDATMARIEDFIACFQCDTNRMEKLYQIYSDYYGRWHPRLLLRIWCWIAILLNKLWSQSNQRETNLSTSSSIIAAIESMCRQIKVIRHFLKIAVPKFEFE